MLYCFIVNGRSDLRAKADAILDAELPGLKIEYTKYYTRGVGDATRYIRLNCDLHPKDAVCYVACGGSGTANEVASGIVGYSAKSMAILSIGDTNDVVKYWSGRDFTSLKGLVEGTAANIDIIKVGDNYALNVINAGFDGIVAYFGSVMIESGVPAVKAYRRAILKSLVGYRFNKVQVTADGQKLNKRSLMMCTIGNGIWCGGQFRCCPNAVNNDGLMEVELFKPVMLIHFFKVMRNYLHGTHLEDKLCLKHINYVRAKHVEMRSRYLIYLSLDGESVASTIFSLDILPGAIRIILPPQQ